MQEPTQQRTRAVSYEYVFRYRYLMECIPSGIKQHKSVRSHSMEMWNHNKYIAQHNFVAVAKLDGIPLTHTGTFDLPHIIHATTFLRICAIFFPFLNRLETPSHFLIIHISDKFLQIQQPRTVGAVGRFLHSERIEQLCIDFNASTYKISRVSSPPIALLLGRSRWNPLVFLWNLPGVLFDLIILPPKVFQ